MKYQPYNKQIIIYILTTFQLFILIPSQAQSIALPTSNNSKTQKIIVSIIKAFVKFKKLIFSKVIHYKGVVILLNANIKTKGDEKYISKCVSINFCIK
ncbi:MAG: hypothetical protein H6553_03230 [Chitinophagales bacterium]|nr:hypothetical protein [Chitinophagales bacterium]